jgi:phage tail-like protein
VIRKEPDPFMNFRFVVEIDHVQRGGFARVKGLAREIKVDVYREGGLNEFEHKFASLATFGNIVLERGLVDDYLWRWQEDVVQGRIVRRNVTISVRDAIQNEVWRWVVDGAFPVKWTGTDLDGASAQAVVESVELAHRGFKRAA